MKKLTTGVLAIVLSSSFALVSAQENKKDTLKTKEIKKVLITGALGIKKKLDAQTSASTVVKSKDLTQASNPNAVQALTGKVSGLTITQSSSNVAGGYRVQLRGSRTINGNTQPLVVIDGVISTMSAYSQLPPEMVGDVNVLKGAQGAALYGADGVNGAIIVTTKKGGRKDKVSVTVTSSLDFDRVAFVPHRQDKYGQGWDGDRIHVENGSWGPAYSDPQYKNKEVAIGIPFYDVDGDGVISINANGDVPTNDAEASVYGKYAPLSKNNVKSFFQTGTNFNNGVSITKGGKNSYVSLSLNRQDREFVVMDDKLRKTSVMFKAGFNSGKWSADGNVTYLDLKTNTTSSGVYDNVLESSTEIPITAFSSLTDRGFAWNKYIHNPYWTIRHRRGIGGTKKINGTATVKYDVNEHISILNRGTVQTSVYDAMSYRDGYKGAEDKQTDATLAINVGNISSFFNQSNSHSQYIYNDLMANFDYNLTEFINLKANTGFNVQQNTSRITSAGGTGLKTPGVYQIWNLTNPTRPYSLSNRRVRNRKLAAFANVDLSYKDYLYVNLTGRYEAVSTLNKDYGEYFYPSAGVSFLPLKAFDKQSNTFSRFVVKYSWVKVGNVPVATYAIEPTAVLGAGYPFGEGPLSFVNQTSPTDPNIRPEFVYTNEVTLGLGFLKNRIRLDASAYIQDTEDLVTRTSTSSASGIFSTQFNAGKLTNKGIEIDLGITPFKSKDFKWDMNFSYATNEQKVLELDKGADEVAVGTLTNVGVYAVKGSAFPLIKGTAYVRDDQGRIVINPNNGNPYYTEKFQVLGRATPKHILGFRTNIKFKNWSAYAVMDYRTGHKFYSGVKQRMSYRGALEESANFDRTQGGFIIPNSVYKDASGNYVENTTVKTGGNSYGSVVQYFGSTYGQIAENFVLDATAFKVRELGLNYSLGRKGLKTIGLTGLTFGVYARNPFYVFAKENKGYGDPEASLGSGNVFGIGGSTQYPSLRTYGFTTTIKF